MFLGYSTGGLADLFDEEEERARRARRSYEEKSEKKRKRPLREMFCAICGDVFYTRHNTQRTCSEECGHELKLRRERARDAEYHRRAYALRLANQRKRSAEAVRGDLTLHSLGDAATHTESESRPPRRPAAVGNKKPRR